MKEIHVDEEFVLVTRRGSRYIVSLSDVLIRLEDSAPDLSGRTRVEQQGDVSMYGYLRSAPLAPAPP